MLAAIVLCALYRTVCAYVRPLEPTPAGDHDHIMILIAAPSPSLQLPTLVRGMHIDIIAPFQLLPPARLPVRERERSTPTRHLSWTPGVSTGGGARWKMGDAVMLVGDASAASTSGPWIASASRAREWEREGAKGAMRASVPDADGGAPHGSLVC